MVMGMDINERAEIAAKRQLESALSHALDSADRKSADRKIKDLNTPGLLLFCSFMLFVVISGFVSVSFYVGSMSSEMHHQLDCSGQR
jgi:hypothetical protein